MPDFSHPHLKDLFGSGNESKQPPSDGEIPRAEPLADAHDHPVFKSTIDQQHRSAGDFSVDGTEPPSDDDSAPPSFGDRYQITGRLGAGGFGVVYQAYDNSLHRAVAIKVPKKSRIATDEQAKVFLAEARLMASFDHPAIVKVFDSGTTADGHVFIVYQLIDGTHLGKHVGQGTENLKWAVEVVASIADALHYAHHRRVVHRDVKPSNILVGNNGHVYLADFGLALREEDFGRSSHIAGTPQYMSPEQARCEGHRVDGRSDEYSLGVVLYELLTGQRPFLAKSWGEIREQIIHREPTPLRQLNDHVPVDLERICLRSLAKRTGDRYSSAGDFAVELRQWLGTPAPSQKLPTPISTSSADPSAAPSTPGPHVTPAEKSRPPVIVPKGLQAYDARDADFFLELLPGPRDKDDLPMAVRFWKDRLENPKADETFAVGLMFGPTGCGKSSLVRAGLMPRLGRHVQAVYVEASGDGIEQRLLQAIRKQFIDHPDMTDLVSAVQWLRKRPTGPKVVLIVDQLEQWLFHCPMVEESEFVQALRQCDGGRVQALLMVRDDDFWMPANRLFRALEIELHEGRNSAAVDLFDKRHARSVLTAFGHAFKTIDNPPTQAQTDFVHQAVDTIAENERVVAVRLVLFAEMFRGKSWTPESLQALGNTTRIGVAYLDDLFGPTSSGQRRGLKPVAMALFEAMLPESNANLKAGAVSEEHIKSKLKAFSSDDIRQTFHLLDHDLRLITPAETEGGSPGYQLTHDSLVPALRTWLARENQTTRQGRAQQLLRERSNLWNAGSSDKRLLPTFLEWTRIRFGTKSNDWTAPQKRMMAVANRRYGIGMAVSLATAALLGVVGYEVQGRVRAHQLVSKLQSADTAQVPAIVHDFAGLERWVWPLVANADTDDLGPQAKTNVLLAKGAQKPDVLFELLSDDRPIVRATAAILLVGIPDSPATLQRSVFDLPISTLALLKPVILRGKQKATLLEIANSIVREPVSNTESSIRQHATAAALLAKYGDNQKLLQYTGATALADVRAQVIHRMAAVDVPYSSIKSLWKENRDPQQRTSFILAAGEYDHYQWPVIDRNDWAIELLESSRTEPDPGLRMATKWLLSEKWSSPSGWFHEVPVGYAAEILEIENKLKAKSPARKDQRWYIDEHVGPMVIIRRPGEFLMGPKPGESTKKNEVLHKRRIDRDFAISVRKVTIREFIAFDPDYQRDKSFSPDDQCPVGVSWYGAAEYCNSLSEKAKLESCFEEVDKKLVLTKDYLKKTGYRLPTEAEWEYAARAGVDAKRYWGNSDELIGHYAHIDQRRQSPVGRLKPNPFGLFDIYGNVREWCIEQFPKGSMPYKGAEAGKPDTVYSDAEWEYEYNREMPHSERIDKRAVRGSAYYELPEHCYAARRFLLNADFPTQEIGFRIVRTIGPDE